MGRRVWSAGPRVGSPRCSPTAGVALLGHPRRGTAPPESCAPPERLDATNPAVWCAFLHIAAISAPDGVSRLKSAPGETPNSAAWCTFRRPRYQPLVFTNLRT